MTFELKDYQEKSVEYAVKNKYCILALEQGLGKSLVSLEAAIRTNSRALIICPAYLRLKWKSEIKKFFPDKVVSLFNSDKDFYDVWDTDFVIISYHFVGKSEKFFEWADMVIIDEAQMLKSMSAIRTEETHRLIYENSVKRLLLLSGTPIQNRTHEFYSLIALCNYNPEILESKFLETYPTYVDFANRFSYLEEFEMLRGNKRVKVQRWKGYRNLEELRSWLKNKYIRFTSEEVLDLPPMTKIEVPVSYEDNPELLKAFEVYNGSLGDEGKNSVASNIKAEAALSKVPFTVDYVKGLIDQGEKVVVYTDHVDSCELLAKKLKATPIHGGTPMKVRQSLADKFMSDPESLVIVATIGSFSTGIDLYSSRHMVFNDLPFVSGILAQALFRIVRLGQTRKCFSHFIMGTIQDFKIFNILEEKIKTIKEVL